MVCAVCPPTFHPPHTPPHHHILPVTGTEAPDRPVHCRCHGTHLAAYPHCRLRYLHFTLPPRVTWRLPPPRIVHPCAPSAGGLPPRPPPRATRHLLVTCLPTPYSSPGSFPGSALAYLPARLPGLPFTGRHFVTGGRLVSQSGGIWTTAHRYRTLPRRHTHSIPSLHALLPRVAWTGLTATPTTFVVTHAACWRTAIPPPRPTTAPPTPTTRWPTHTLPLPVVLDGRCCLYLPPCRWRVGLPLPRFGSPRLPSGRHRTVMRGFTPPLPPPPLVCTAVEHTYPYTADSAPSACHTTLPPASMTAFVNSYPTCPPTHIPHHTHPTTRMVSAAPTALPYPASLAPAHLHTGQLHNIPPLVTWMPHVPPACMPPAHLTHPRMTL